MLCRLEDREPGWLLNIIYGTYRHSTTQSVTLRVCLGVYVQVIFGCSNDRSRRAAPQPAPSLAGCLSTAQTLRQFHLQRIEVHRLTTHSMAPIRLSEVHTCLDASRDFVKPVSVCRRANAGLRLLGSDGDRSCPHAQDDGSDDDGETDLHRDSFGQRGVCCAPRGLCATSFISTRRSDDLSICASLR